MASIISFGGTENYLLFEDSAFNVEEVSTNSSEDEFLGLMIKDRTFQTTLFACFGFYIIY